MPLAPAGPGGPEGPCGPYRNEISTIIMNTSLECIFQAFIKSPGSSI